MKGKRFWMPLTAALLLLALLPAGALALSGHKKTEAEPVAFSEISEEEAREYVIKFGVEHRLGQKDKYPIYSAPDLNAVRGAKGKATLATAGGADSAGWEGAWLLMRYEKSNGGYRVGWVPKSSLNMNTIEATRSVNFAYSTVVLAEDCRLTDDPLMESETLCYADAGEQLTYLAYYRYGAKGKEYAYVRGDYNGQPVCGFIPFDAIAW